MRIGARKTANKAVNRCGCRRVIGNVRFLVAARLPWSFRSKQLQFEKVMSLSTTQQLEETVRWLSTVELAAFRAWFAAFDAEEWDRQIESDVAAGRLDWLIQHAVADHRAGRCTDR